MGITEEGTLFLMRVLQKLVGYNTKYKRMAENTPITPNRLGSSQEQRVTRTSGHTLVKPTQVFEATLTRSFQRVRNCCSHETLLHEATCEFKRRDTVNHALISGERKNTPSTAAISLVPTHSS